MDDQPNDGGPAFPIPGMDQVCAPYAGMSLRDWFAGQALVGFLANGSDHSFKSAEDAQQSAARVAFGIADAMLDARQWNGDRTSEHAEKDSA